MSELRLKAPSSAGVTHQSAIFSEEPTGERASSNRSRRQRVALGTSTGAFVDQHFATASRFRIFEFADGKWSFIEDRENVNPRCGCGSETGCDSITFSGPLSILSDVDLVVVSRIGADGAAALLERGIRGQLATGPIADVLTHLEHSPKLKYPLRRKG
jgi:predicted Fe-Mo cluster-binding NifX family protein